jgi:hypothetical protein
MVGRRNINLTRSDWDQVRYKIMQWVLEVKLSQNWEIFANLLLSTGDKHIVEKVPKEKVWGAVQEGNNFVGINALGRLLMHVRERYVKTNDQQRCIEPLNIPDFLLFGHPIESVCNEQYYEEIRWSISQHNIEL